MISTSRVLQSCYHKIGSNARDDDKMFMKRHNIFIFFNAFTYPLSALFVVKPYQWNILCLLLNLSPSFFFFCLSYLQTKSFSDLRLGFVVFISEHLNKRIAVLYD